MYSCIYHLNHPSIYTSMYSLFLFMSFYLSLFILPPIHLSLFLYTHTYSIHTSIIHLFIYYFAGTGIFSGKLDKSDILMQQASEEFAYNEATMQYNYDEYSYNQYNDNNYHNNNPNNDPQNHDINHHNHHQYVDENPDFPSLAVNSTTSITTNNSEKSFSTKASTKVSSSTSTALQSAPTAAAAAPPLAPHPLSIMHASRFGTSREALRRKEIQLAEQQRIDRKEQEARRVQRNLILAAALLDDNKESGNAINYNSGTAAPAVSSTASKMFVPMNYSYAESQKIATKTFNSTTLTAANIGTTLNDETYVHKLTSSLLKYGWNEMMLMRTLYPKSLITWGKQNQSEVLKIERKLYMLLNDSKLNSIQFKPMTYPMRSIVHQLSRMYLLNSYEYDYQPNRYVSVVKQHDSYLPSYTLSKAIILPLFHLSSLLSTYSDYPTYSLNSNSTTIPEQSLPVSSTASSSTVVGKITQISTSTQESSPSISTQGSGVTDTSDKQCIIYLTINNESFLTQLLQTNSKSSSTKSSLSSSSISSTNINSIINNSSSTSTTLLKNDAMRIAFTIAEIIIRLNIILESQELWQDWYDYTTNTIFYNYNIDDVGNNSNSSSNSRKKHTNDKNSGKVDSNIIQEFIKFYRIQQHSLSAINICNNSKSNNNDNSDGNNHINNESYSTTITHLINCGASSIGIGFLNNTMVQLAYHFLKFCLLLQSNQLSKNDISSTLSSNSNINSSGKLKSVRNYVELSILSLLNVQGNFVIDDNIIIDMLYYGDSSSNSSCSCSGCDIRTYDDNNSGSCCNQQRVSVLFREFLLNNNSSNNSNSSSNNQDFDNYIDDIVTTTISVTGKLLNMNVVTIMNVL